MIDAINSLLSMFSQNQYIQTSTELVTGPPGKAVHVTLIPRRSQLMATEAHPIRIALTQTVTSAWYMMLSQQLSNSMYNVNGRHANDVILTW